MYIETVPNRGSRPAVLLREGWREGKRIRKRTIANLTHWPTRKIEALRKLLKGQELVPADELFSVKGFRPHGHVEAVLGTLRKLGLERLLSNKPCRQRDLVVAMIVQRLLQPGSKLASVRLWQSTTLAEELALQDASVDELYDALDWLRKRQERIQDRLAQWHLEEGSFVLYDVSSSTYEGHVCPLAHFGHNRDGKKGKRCIVYGLLTDDQGRPIVVNAYPGGTGDPKTVPDQVKNIRQRFGLMRVVLVGDRGLLTKTQIDALRRYPGLGWISALRAPAIQGLVKTGDLQLSLFDHKDLAEISSPEYPGERLIACFNPLLAEERRRKRQELVASTEKQLERISRDVGRRTKKPYSNAEIGAKVGSVLNRFKVAKHFVWKIEKGQLRWERREESIRREQELDGIYVIRTSESEQNLSSEDTVRSYKSLSQVERAFRCLKSDLEVRPIYLWDEDHVRAHIFLCMLAYYVEWHMRKAWAPLLFADEQLQQERKTRDPVKPAKPSASAKAKKIAKTTPDGLPVHSFTTLLEDLAQRARYTYSLHSDDEATFRKITDPSPLQTQALQLLELFPVN